MMEIQRILRSVAKDAHKEGGNPDHAKGAEILETVAHSLYENGLLPYSQGQQEHRVTRKQRDRSATIFEQAPRDRSVIATTLTSWREATYMSRRDLAEKLTPGDLPPKETHRRMQANIAQIRRIEKQEVTARLNVLESIAGVFGMTARDLIEGKPLPPPNEEK